MSGQAVKHAIEWRSDALFLLDQRALPHELLALRCETYHEVALAITNMVVRGAPAIGITAAFGLVLAARQARHARNPAALLAAARDELANSRPTAVNLHWALQRLAPTIEHALQHDGVDQLESQLLALARGMHEEDLAANQRMGAAGAEVLATAGCQRVMTHCNTGMLATGGHGTALGVIREAWSRGLIEHVHVDETRPWLQGTRLTAWELQRDGIPFSVNADGAAAHIMRSFKPTWVIVGADRITANGDTANKIGTYGLAVLARHHGLGFMVVAPTSTIDPSLPDGAAVEIEERSADELFALAGQRLAPTGSVACNPVFDVTPAELIDCLVTERGVIHQPDSRQLAELLQQDPA